MNNLIRGKGFGVLVVALAVSIFGLLPATSSASAKNVADLTGGIEPTPYVVNGSDANASDFPWQVVITANGNEFCGGTLIHPMIVLTAGHCVVDENGNYFEDLPNVSFRAFVGQTQLGVGGEELDWNVAQVSPSYNAATAEYDWGYIVLNSPASAPTIQIAGQNERGLWRAGRKATVTGFGDLSDGGAGSTILQKLKMPILSNGACANYGSTFHSKSQLCAGFPNGGRDACQGDSGGPLSVTGDYGVRRLVGIVSTGKGCALAGFPGIYTKAADWIISDTIQLEVESLESYHEFPAQYRGIDVTGSGAKPLGCAKKVASRKKSEKNLKVAQRNLKAARKTRKSNRIAAAKRRVESAKYRLSQSRAKSRKACS